MRHKRNSMCLLFSSFIFFALPCLHYTRFFSPYLGLEILQPAREKPRSRWPPPPNPAPAVGNSHHPSSSTAALTAAGGTPAESGREMTDGTCSVCNEAPSKYKCPSCRTPYCSVTCFKNHKEKSCQKTLPEEETGKSSLQEEETGKSELQEEETAHSSGLQEGGAECLSDKNQQPAPAPDTTCPAKSTNTPCPIKSLEVEDPTWLVDNNRLRSIAELKEIRDAVRDTELQKMILKIDGSSEPEKELEKMMQDQAFRQFTDKILDIVSPQE